LTAILLLSFAAIAFAAFHTTANTYHGIGSSTGGGVGAGAPYAQSTHPFLDIDVQSSMYHVYDNGTLHRQCNDGPKSSHSLCYGIWGTAPCQKRAYMQSFAVGAGQLMPWHWMRGASCPGQTHQ
jgi:hypothetical protein